MECAVCPKEYVCVGDQSPTLRPMSCGHLICTVCLKDDPFSSCPHCDMTGQQSIASSHSPYADSGPGDASLCDRSEYLEGIGPQIVESSPSVNDDTSSTSSSSSSLTSFELLEEVAASPCVTIVKAMFEEALNRAVAKVVAIEHAIPPVATDQIACGEADWSPVSSNAPIADPLSESSPISISGEHTGSTQGVSEQCTSISESVKNCPSRPQCPECCNGAVEVVCDDCKPSLVACTVCCDALHTTPSRKTHIRTLWTESRVDPAIFMCAVHPDYCCDLYCENCMQTACVVCCSAGAHRGHNAVTVADAASKHAEALRVLKNGLESDRHTAEEASKNIRIFLAEINNNRAPNHGHVIRTQFALARQKLDEKEHQLLQEKTEMFTMAKVSFLKRVELLNSFCRAVTASVATAEELLELESRNPKLFLHTQDSTRGQMAAAGQICDPRYFHFDSSEHVVVNRCPEYIQTVLDALGSEDHTGGLIALGMPQMESTSDTMSDDDSSDCGSESSSRFLGQCLVSSNSAVVSGLSGRWGVLPFAPYDPSAVPDTAFVVLGDKYLGQKTICIKNLRSGLYLGRATGAITLTENTAITDNELWGISRTGEDRAVLYDPFDSNSVLTLVKAVHGRPQSLRMVTIHTGCDCQFRLVSVHEDAVVRPPVGYMCSASGLWVRSAIGGTHRYYCACTIREGYSFSSNGTEYFPEKQTGGGFHHNKMGQLVQTRHDYYYNCNHQYVRKV